MQQLSQKTEAVQKLNSVNPSVRNPSAIPPCPNQVEELTEKILVVVRQYHKNESIFIAKTQTQAQEIHDLKEILIIRESRIKRLIGLLEGKVTDWHKIRDWFLIFATIGQFGFIMTQLL